MSQVTATVGADNLRALHSESRVRMPRYSAGDAVEVRGPAATGFEFVICLVEGSVAGGTGVDARGRHVLVVFAGEWGFGTLLAQNTELLCGRDEFSIMSTAFPTLGAENVRGVQLGLAGLTFVQDCPPLIIGASIWIRHLL